MHDAQFERDGDTLRCVFSGRLDTKAAAELGERINQQIKDAPGPVEFDFAKVEYLSSAFLRICLRIAKQVGNANFRVVRIDPAVRKILETAGFQNVINLS